MILGFDVVGFQGCCPAQSSFVHAAMQCSASYRHSTFKAGGCWQAPRLTDYISAATPSPADDVSLDQEKKKTASLCLTVGIRRRLTGKSSLPPN